MSVQKNKVWPYKNGEVVESFLYDGSLHIRIKIEEDKLLVFFENEHYMGFAHYLSDYRFDYENANLTNNKLFVIVNSKKVEYPSVQCAYLINPPMERICVKGDVTPKLLDDIRIAQEIQSEIKKYIKEYMPGILPEDF